MIGEVYRYSQELLSQTLIVHLQFPKSRTFLESVLNQNHPKVQDNTTGAQRNRTLLPGGSGIPSMIANK